MNSHRSYHLSLIVLSFGLLPLQTQAQLFYDVDGATAGFSGNTGVQVWDAAATNWSSAAAGDAATAIWTDANTSHLFSSANQTVNLGVGFNPGLTGLVFSEGSGGELILGKDAGGNSISIGAGGIVNGNTISSNLLTIQPDILLTANQTWALSGAPGTSDQIRVEGAVNLGTNDLTFDVVGDSIRVIGAISGSGDIVHSSAAGGFLRLESDFTAWTGDFQLTGGTNARTQISSSLSSSNHVFQGGTGTLEIVADDVTLASNFTLTSQGTFSQGAIRSEAANTLVTGNVEVTDNSAVRASSVGNRLTFTGGTFTYTGTANRSLRAGGSGEVTFNVPITDDGAGVGNLTVEKRDDGVLIMNANHTYDGSTNLLGGIVSVSSMTNSNTAGSLGEGDLINFGANFGTTNFGTLRVTGTTSTDRRLQIQADAISGVPNPGNGGGIEVTGTNEATFSGAIDRGGDVGSEPFFHKTGSGTLLLTNAGANTFDGHLTVKGGTFLTNTNLGSVRTTVVEDTATLGGNGTLGGTVTLEFGSTIAPGASLMDFGLLSLSDTATFETGSTAAFQIGNSLTPLRGTDFDALNVTNALVWGGDLNLHFASALSDGTYSWDLFNFGSESGDLGSITLGSSYSGSLSRSGDLWSLATANESWSFDQTSGVLGVTLASAPIPEPTRICLISFAVLGMLTRRHRSCR